MANEGNNVITCILTALVIVVAVSYIFNNSQCGLSRMDTNGRQMVRRVPRMALPSDEAFDNLSTKTMAGSSGDLWQSLNMEEVTADSPEPHNDRAAVDYRSKLLAGSVVGSGCPPPPKSRDQFNNDFFAFRDMTQHNSSIKEDPVDRIQQMYLDGSLAQVNGNNNTKIKDVFDKLTAGPDKYTRQCVRLPSFDLAYTAGYQMSFGGQFTPSNGNNWTYPNEKIINGGEIKPGLRGADPYDNYNLDLRMMDMNMEVNYGHKE